VGVDLTVCPNQFRRRDPTEKQWFLAYNRLRFDRDYRLFAQLSEDFSYRRPDVPGVVAVEPFPPTWTFSWYGDEGLTDETTDAYDGPLSFVRAKEFRKIVPADDTTKWNLCVLAFLSVLDPDTEVVLYWH
jgi:hypothetical protein